MQEHVNDTYVQLAQKEGWRSRAVFKLKEIDTKDHLLKPGMTVVDLGATPGSWSQYAVKRIQPGGRLIALDLLAMEPLAGVDFIQGDFREDAVLEQLKSALGRPKPTSAPLWGAASRGCERGGPSESALAGRQVDLVLSDMAPNMTGIAATDSAQVMLLAELTLDFSRQHLKPGGALLVKVFQGPGFMELRKALQEGFATLTSRKPAASRDRSAELYLLAKQMKVV